jgi:hypothetical protein
VISLVAYAWARDYLVIWICAWLFSCLVRVILALMDVIWLLICGPLIERVSNSLHNIERMHYRTPLTCPDS